MEQAERLAKEKMALTVVKSEAGSPPPSATPMAAPQPSAAQIPAVVAAPPNIATTKVLIKQDISGGSVANGGFELIPPAPPIVVGQSVTAPALSSLTPKATLIVGGSPVVKVKEVKADPKDGIPAIKVIDLKDIAKDNQPQGTAGGVVIATACALTPKGSAPALSKAAKKRQAAKERERLAQERFKRQRFEQRVANDQKEVLAPRLEPFLERQEAIKRLLVYHTTDVAEPSVLALQQCDAAFERLSARMLQAKEHLVSRFQLASLKSGMVSYQLVRLSIARCGSFFNARFAPFQSDTPTNERLLVSQLLLEDEKRLQSERVEETLSLMEQPDSSDFYAGQTATTASTTQPVMNNTSAVHQGQHYSSDLGAGFGMSRRLSSLMDSASCDGSATDRDGSCRPADVLLAEELEDEYEDDHVQMDQHSDDGARNPDCLMNDSMDEDVAASCQLTSNLADSDSAYHRLGIPSVHSQTGEDSLSELVTDGQLLSNQLLAQSDDPDLDNAVNSILFA